MYQALPRLIVGVKGHTYNFERERESLGPKLGIKATYLGSAQFTPLAESEVYVFSQDADTLIMFVSPEWLFSKDDRNLMRVCTVKVV